MPLYVKIGNEAPLLLSSLTEPQFAEVFAKLDAWERKEVDSRFDADPTGRVVYQSVNGISSRLMFVDTRLDWASFHQMNELFSFSLDPNGPFYELGMTKAEMIKAFGRPDRWKRAERGGV